jgi:hypothetical protein
MTTKFEIGDKVKIVEKELPKTGIKYFDYIIEHTSYLTYYKQLSGKEGIVKDYDEIDDTYIVEGDDFRKFIPAYFLEPVPTVKYAVYASLHSEYSLPWHLAEFDTKEEAINYMREVVAKQASAAIKKGKEYKYKISDTVAMLEDYCIFVKECEDDK